MPLAIEVRTMNSLSRSLDLTSINSRWSLYQTLKRPSADFMPSVKPSSLDLCSDELALEAGLACDSAGAPRMRAGTSNIDAARKRQTDLAIGGLPISKK